MKNINKLLDELGVEEKHRKVMTAVFVCRGNSAEAARRLNLSRERVRQIRATYGISTAITKALFPKEVQTRTCPRCHAQFTTNRKFCSESCSYPKTAQANGRPYCSLCGDIDDDSFYQHKSGVRWCRPCAKEHHRKYYERNLHSVRARQNLRAKSRNCRVRAIIKAHVEKEPCFCGSTDRVRIYIPDIRKPYCFAFLCLSHFRKVKAGTHTVAIPIRNYREKLIDRRFIKKKYLL